MQNLGASRTLFDTAQQALATVQCKFDQGAADILKILSTQAALANALLERIHCQAN